MAKHTAQPVRMLLRYGAITGAAALLVLLFRTVAPANETTVALAFVVLVVITASRWRLAYSVFTSIVCALFYNFFFLPPVGRFVIAAPENWVALGAFLGTSVLVSHLAEREHQQAQASEERRREIERLYEFSQALLLEENAPALAAHTPPLAARIFGFRAVALQLAGNDAVHFSDPHEQLPSETSLRLAEAQGETSIRVEDGYLLVPVRLGLQPMGMLAIAGRDFSAGLLEAIASLLAIAVERATSLERTSRLEAARENERLRNALLDSLTHDLRTPLTSIRAAATTMLGRSELPDSERAELAAVIDEESARLDRIIGQALEMAQLDADAVQLERAPVAVRELVELAMEETRSLLCRHRAQVAIPEELPPVYADRALMLRVVRHLLENAAQYSPEETAIELTAREEGGRVGVSIRDHGPGISPAEQPFVFDKFYRGSQRQIRAKGSGMGLAIARSIVKAHGGQIQLVSAPGHGSEFIIWLDAASTEPAEMKEPRSG